MQILDFPDPAEVEAQNEVPGSFHSRSSIISQDAHISWPRPPMGILEVPSVRPTLVTVPADRERRP